MADPVETENANFVTKLRKISSSIGSWFDWLGEWLDKVLQAGAINLTDIQHTTPRIVQVATAVIANAKVHFTTFINWIRDLSKPSAGAASDTDNPDSYFNHMMHKANGQLTAFGIGTIAASGLAFAAGIVYTIYKVAYNRYLHSKKRLKTKMKAYEPNPDAHELSSHINTQKDHYHAQHPEFEIVTEGNRKIRYAMKRVRGSVFNKQSKGEFKDATDVDGKALKKKTRLNWVNRITNSRVVALLAKPWNWMVNQSMWYWVTWFFAVMIVGGSALTLGGIAAPVLLPIVAVTLGIGFTLSAIKLVGKVRGYLADKKQLTDIQALLRDPNHESVTDNVLKASIVALNTYYNNQKGHWFNKEINPEVKAKFLLAKYKKYKAQDDAALEGKLSAWMTSVFTGFAGMKIRGNAPDVRNETLVEADQDKNPILLNKKLTKLLIPSNHERQLFSTNRVIGQMAFGFVIPFFITSMLAAFGLAIIPHIGILGITAAALKGNAVFQVLNGARLPAIWGAVKTLLFGASTIASRRQAELDYKIKVARVMTNEKVSEFNALEAQFRSLRNHFLQGSSKNHLARKRLLEQFPNFETWDPYNSTFFEEHSDKRTPWSWTRKTMRTLLEPFAGSQTGVLIIRFTCLAGMVALGFITGGIPPLIFLSVAAVAAVIFGTNRLVSWHLDRRQKHRENFLNTFDSRIQFLKDVNAKFESLLNNTAPSDAPAPASQGIPVNGNGTTPKSTPSQPSSSSPEIRGSSEPPMGGNGGSVTDAVSAPQSVTETVEVTKVAEVKVVLSNSPHALFPAAKDNKGHVANVQRNRSYTTNAM